MKIKYSEYYIRLLRILEVLKIIIKLKRFAERNGAQVPRQPCSELFFSAVHRLIMKSNGSTEVRLKINDIKHFQLNNKFEAQK